MWHSHHIQIKTTCCWASRDPSLLAQFSLSSRTMRNESFGWHRLKTAFVLLPLPRRWAVERQNVFPGDKEWYFNCTQLIPQALVIRMPLEISRWHWPSEILEKTILYYRWVAVYWFAVWIAGLTSLFHTLFRHNYNSSIINRDRNGNIGTSVCNKCTSRSSLLPNPSYGSDGSSRRHLETTRKRCVCTQTSRFRYYSYSAVDDLKGA